LNTGESSTLGSAASLAVASRVGFFVDFFTVEDPVAIAPGSDFAFFAAVFLTGLDATALLIDAAFFDLVGLAGDVKPPATAGGTDMSAATSVQGEVGLISFGSGVDFLFTAAFLTAFFSITQKP
jgi:hypothetical protein